MNKKERPIIEDLVNSGTSDLEKFQNEVIRPVIKMQHDLLIAFYQNYIQQRKIDFISLKLDKQKKNIRTSISKDINFRNILLGTIIGHFSMPEFAFYHKNTSEVNRRITQIIKQRLQDSVSEI